MKTFLRSIIALLGLAAVGIAVVPLLVILDIREGGDGWGLCVDGLAGCRTTYFAGFEFVTGVVLVLFGLLALIAGCVRLMRRLDRRAGLGQS